MASADYFIIMYLLFALPLLCGTIVDLLSRK